jgi:putative ABC transport system permease protein
VIVNQTLAHRYWPGRDPLGRRFLLDQETAPVEVVGVAANSAYMALGEKPAPFLYLPMGQRFTRTATLHVRTAGSPRRLTEAVRREFHVLDPDLPVLVRPLDDALAEALWLPRTAAELLSLSALVGLSLATVGIYGLAAHGARRRSREIGLCIALGAPKLAIARLVTLRTLGAVGVGLGLGLALVAPLGRWLSRFLYGSVPAGIPMLATALLLVAAAAIASLVPALRALRASATGGLRSLRSRT